VSSKSSSVATEIGWLAYFLTVFVAAVYLLVRTLVPHHFNDKIAIALAALFSGLIMIATRAWLTRRKERR
jgi:lipopolysaccharide export LptBFGC system permease protein LptF